jgi:hypothetical protein
MSQNMPQTVKVSCDAYVRNPDGSWTAIKINDIQTTDRSIRINTGITFSKGRLIWGIDVASLLEEQCAKQGKVG